jgi:hypothetical protein
MLTIENDIALAHRCAEKAATTLFNDVMTYNLDETIIPYL